MYRGTCIGSIYPTLIGFGGIQAITLSYTSVIIWQQQSWILTVTDNNDNVSRNTNMNSMIITDRQFDYCAYY